MVPSELPDSSTAICLLRREEEKYYSGAVGSTAESCTGLRTQQGQGGRGHSRTKTLHWQSGLGPGSAWQRSAHLLSGSCSAAALG